MSMYCAGDVVIVDFHNCVGHQQHGVRPALIVSNNVGNNFSPTICVIPFTTNLSKVNQPTHAYFEASQISGLKQDSILLAEAMTAINKSQIQKRIGKLEDEELRKASIAMANHIAPMFRMAYESGIMEEKNFSKLAG